MLVRLDRIVAVSREAAIAEGELVLLEADVVEEVFLIAPLAKHRGHRGRGIEALLGAHVHTVALAYDIN